MLTSKQQRFVDEYPLDLNATQAANRAGYSARTAEAIGHENLRKPNIAAAISESQRQRQERTQLDADMVVEGLLKEATEQHNPGSTRIRAWQLLGRHLGMFRDRVEVEMRASIAHRAEVVTRLSDGDLQALIQASRAQVVDSEARVLPEREDQAV